MTRVMVRRRSEPVEAVQWHKPGDHPAVRTADWGSFIPNWQRYHIKGDVRPGMWIVPAARDTYRVLTPEQFAEEYERVDAALGRDV